MGVEGVFFSILELRRKKYDFIWVQNWGQLGINFFVRDIRFRPRVHVFAIFRRFDHTYLKNAKLRTDYIKTNYIGAT